MHRQSCYMWIDEKKDWQEAYNHCKNNDGDLVSILNKQENEFLKGKILLTIFVFYVSMDSIEICK